MTRLEQTGEPSMEDILASIRKIIAEDPPGSRSLPEVRAEPAAPSVTDRIFQRMGDAVRSEQAKPAAAPAATSEPYLRSSMPSLSSTPSLTPSAEAVTPFDTTAKPFDIDAQMAEVLSKTRGGTPRRDVEPSFDSVAPQVQAALDSLPLASNVPAPLSRAGFTVARDGFVPDAPKSGPLNASMNAPVKSPVNDPFEFSLGPSPFASRSGPQPALDTSMPDVRDTRFQDFGTFIPTRPAEHAAAVETPIAAKASEISIPEAVAAEIPVAPVVESVETAPAERASISVPTPEAIAAQLKDFDAAVKSPEAEPEAALESVDKVLAELKLKLDHASVPEPEAALVKAPESMTGFAAAETEQPVVVEPAQQDPIGLAPEPERVTLAAEEPRSVDTEATAATIAEAPVSDIVLIAEPAPIAAPEIVREMEREFERELVRETAQEMVVAEPVRATQTENSTSPFHMTQVPAMHNAGALGSRSMEDTVAELLRPMLRNWLAENMPKIVERALRKEIDDSLHSEHKTAAE